ncbi:hypothetical protein BASA81_005820 [Batrachochytrium salamandrivorans]|nr:hypothetical protein BASA81_005820 [Batrachochytrium salamandrivorans]
MFTSSQTAAAPPTSPALSPLPPLPTTSAAALLPLSSPYIFPGQLSQGESTLDMINRQLSPWMFSASLKMMPGSPSSTSAGTLRHTNSMDGSGLGSPDLTGLSPKTLNMLLGTSFAPSQPSSQPPQQQQQPGGMDHRDTVKKAAQVSLNLFNISNKNNHHQQLRASSENRLFAPVSAPSSVSSTSASNTAAAASFDPNLQLPSSVGWFTRTLSQSNVSANPVFDSMMMAPLSLPSFVVPNPTAPSSSAAPLFAHPAPLPTMATEAVITTNNKRPATGAKRKASSDSAYNSEDGGNGEAKITSKHRGVCWYKRTKKWVVQTKVNGKRVHVGYFDDEDKAAEAYRSTVAGIQRTKQQQLQSKQQQQQQQQQEEEDEDEADLGEDAAATAVVEHRVASNAYMLAGNGNGGSDNVVSPPHEIAL